VLGEGWWRFKVIDLSEIREEWFVDWKQLREITCRFMEKILVNIG
jgi:hypothetical protein